MKRLINLILMLSMMLLCSGVVHAASDYNNTCEIHAKVTASQNFLNATSRVIEENVDSLTEYQEVTILAQDNTVNLLINNKEREIIFSGLLFTSINLTSSVDKDVESNKSLVVLGDFLSTQTYNVSSFRVLNGVDSGNAEIKITLENILSGSICRITATISSDDYEMIHRIAVENTKKYLEEYTSKEKKEELALKLVSLMQEESNYINEYNVSAVGGVQPLVASANSYTYSTKNANTGATVSKTYLQTFFNGLNNNGYFDCSSYSTLRMMLSQTGWRAYTNKTSGYFYVMYGVENGSSEYLVQISYGEMQKEHFSNKNFHAEFEIKGSVLLSYNTILKRATVLLYETGLRLTSGQFYLVINSASSAYFTQATRLYAFESNESQFSVGSVLKSLYTGLDIAFSLFTRPSVYQSDTTAFYNTTTGAADCLAGNNYIWGTGGKMGVSGFFGGTLSSSTYGYDFQFVCRHNL